MSDALNDLVRRFNAWTPDTPPVFDDYVAVPVKVLRAIEARADRCVTADHYTAEMALRDLQDIRAIIAAAGLRTA